MHVLVSDERGQLTLDCASKWRQSLARLYADRLDRELARGSRPESGLLLAVRAMQLTSGPMRGQLAASIGRVESAGRPRLVARRNRAVLAEIADVVDELSDALLASGSIGVRGVAMVNLLLADSAGPLYHPGRAGELEAFIRQAIEALTPSGYIVTYP
jgi:hypothetical protein